MTRADQRGGCSYRREPWGVITHTYKLMWANSDNSELEGERVASQCHCRFCFFKAKTMQRLACDWKGPTKVRPSEYE